MNKASTLPRLLAEAAGLHRSGQLDRAEALYHRILARHPTQPDALHLLGLVRHARGEHEPALAAIDGAIAASGRVAAFHVSRASVLSSLGRSEEAIDAARHVLVLDSHNAEAHNVLGNALLRAGEAEAAVESYRRAVASRPNYAEAYNNLGSALRSLGHLEDAEAELRRALVLRDGYASALANLGLVLQEQGRYGEALDTYERAVAADPQHPAARGNRAMLLLLLGRLSEGFAEYEWRWRMPGFATPRRSFPQPRWDGGEFAGRTLFVHAEQGLGSAIQFVRYAALAAARGGRVVLECQPPLLRLFRYALTQDGGPVADVVTKGEEPPPFDCQAPLMSLPHLLGTTLATIPGRVPYLGAAPEAVAGWHERLSPLARPKIGLVWAGNPQHENDRNRSMPARSLAPLVARSRATFFSLQVPAMPASLAEFPSGSIRDLAPVLADFADTAVVIANLDLVISVDTAVAHLAGALGKPVWLLLPYVPEWRWLLDRDDSPWYPTMRLYRQRRAGDWEELIRRVAVALQVWCARRSEGR
jgi:tetratricopeptide (TPR) repeat protein